MVEQFIGDQRQLLYVDVHFMVSWMLSVTIMTTKWKFHGIPQDSTLGPIQICMFFWVRSMRRLCTQTKRVKKYREINKGTCGQDRRWCSAPRKLTSTCLEAICRLRNWTCYGDVKRIQLHQGKVLFTKDEVEKPDTFETLLTSLLFERRKGGPRKRLYRHEWYSPDPTYRCAYCACWCRASTPYLLNLDESLFAGITSLDCRIAEPLRLSLFQK